MVNAIIEQRWIRTICSFCKKERNLIDNEKEAILKLLPEKNRKKFETLNTVNYGEGCRNCNNTGYLGRTGIYEVLTMDEEIRDLILVKLSSTEIQARAIELGMITMLEDGLTKVLKGLTKVLKGLTTVEKVLRVTHE